MRLLFLGVEDLVAAISLVLVVVLFDLAQSLDLVLLGFIDQKPLVVLHLH